MKSKLISQLSIDYAKTEPLMKSCFDVAGAKSDITQYLEALREDGVLWNFSKDSIINSYILE